MLSSPLRSSQTSVSSSSSSTNLSAAEPELFIPTMTNESRGRLRVGGRTAYYQAAQLAACEAIEDRCQTPSIIINGWRESNNSRVEGCERRSRSFGHLPERWFRRAGIAWRHARARRHLLPAKMKVTHRTTKAFLGYSTGMAVPSARSTCEPMCFRSIGGARLPSVPFPPPFRRPRFMPR